MQATNFFHTTNGFAQQGMQPSLWLPWRQSPDWFPANEHSAQVQCDQWLTSTPVPQAQATSVTAAQWQPFLWSPWTQSPDLSRPIERPAMETHDRLLTSTPQKHVKVESGGVTQQEVQPSLWSPWRQSPDCHPVTEGAAPQEYNRLSPLSVAQTKVSASVADATKMAADKSFVPFVPGQNFDSGIYDYESDTSFTSVDDSLATVNNAHHATPINVNITPQPSVTVDHMVAPPVTFTHSLSCGTLPVSSSLSSHVDVPITVQVALLQVRFLSVQVGKCKAQQAKRDELQTFYDLQSAQLESERYQLLCQHRTESLLCASINSYHDDEHRHLVTMTGNSLALLEDELSQTEDSRDGDDKSAIPHVPLDGSATQHMSIWFERNLRDPYPSPREKWEMAAEGRMTVAQVNKWFSNKRIRSDSVRHPASKRRC